MKPLTVILHVGRRQKGKTMTDKLYYSQDTRLGTQVTRTQFQVERITVSLQQVEDILKIGTLLLLNFK